MKPTSYALIVGLILTTALPLAAGEDGIDKKLREQATKSLMLGRWGFIAKSHITVDTVWSVRKALEAQPDERLRAWVDERAAELKEDRFARLIHPDAERPPLPETPGDGMRKISNYILAAVGSPEERAVDFIREYAESEQQSYALTHQVFVIEWGGETGLEIPHDVKQRIPALTEKVAAELATSRRFNDLYAERAALIMMYGDPTEQDVARWVRTIIAEQEEDGLWGSSHTDGFCLVVLSLLLKNYG